jgi:TetR/AcrR family fatty acid metabolism transcriptional regulator
MHQIGPADKRQAILEAAQHVFAESGFHTSTMDAVADAAGVAKGTIYLYFKSKNELLTELMDDRTNKLTRMLVEGVEAESDVHGKLKALIVAHFDFYAQEREFMLLLSRQLGLLSPELATRVVQGTAFLTGLTQSIIEEGVSAGAVSRSFDPARLTYALLGMVHAVAYQWLASGMRANAEDVAD